MLIRHNRRQLDLALPVHLLGLTNMAKLDLIKTEATKEDAKVRIGLEVANERGRLQREFDPVVSLWDVVESFEKDDGRFGKDKNAQWLELSIGEYICEVPEGKDYLKWSFMNVLYG